MGTIQNTLERWRSGVRLGETAVVIGFWVSGITSSDAVIANVLLILGFAVGGVAILADPNGSKKTSALLLTLLAVCFLAAEGIFLWRHTANAQASTAPAALPAPAKKDVATSESIPAPPLAAQARAPAIGVTRVTIREVAVPVAAEPTKISAVTPKQTPIITADDYIKTYKKSMARDNVSYWASARCERNNLMLEASIVSLTNEAVVSENQFHEYRNTKQIVGDLNKWLPAAEKFIKDNKDKLPDITVFSLANGSARTGLFQGSGVAAWSILDEKRQALQSIRANIHARQCDIVGKAAMADCEKDDSCQASLSVLMNSSQ